MYLCVQTQCYFMADYTWMYTWFGSCKALFHELIENNKHFVDHGFSIAGVVEGDNIMFLCC